MDSSFTPIEQMLKFRASRHEDFPYQEILLTRLCMHMQGKLLENRNKMLKAQGINETLFAGRPSATNWPFHAGDGRYRQPRRSDPRKPGAQYASL